MADAAQMVFGVNSHLLVALFGSGDHARDSLPPVSQHREHFEVARSYTLCLCHNCVRDRSGLARGRARHVRSVAAERTRGMGNDGRHSRHDDQSLLVLLASLAGNRRTKGSGTPDGCAEGRYPWRIGCARNGCRRRHAIFKSCDVPIILTTALTLHRHGITNIETTRQAAEALIPFAGKFAALLFTLVC